MNAPLKRPVVLTEDEIALALGRERLCRLLAEKRALIAEAELLASGPARRTPVGSASGQAAKEPASALQELER